MNDSSSSVFELISVTVLKIWWLGVKTTTLYLLTHLCYYDAKILFFLSRFTKFSSGAKNLVVGRKKTTLYFRTQEYSFFFSLELQNSVQGLKNYDLNGLTSICFVWNMKWG